MQLFFIDNIKYIMPFSINMHSPRDEEQRRLLQKMALSQFYGPGPHFGEVSSDSPVLDLEESLSSHNARRIFLDVQKLEDCAYAALSAVEQYGQYDSRVDVAALNCGIMCKLFTAKDIAQKHEEYRNVQSRKTRRQIEQLGVGHPDLTDRIADAVALWVRNPNKGLSINSLHLAQEKYLDRQDDVVLQKAVDVGVGDDSIKEQIARALERTSMNLDHLVYAHRSYLRKQEKSAVGSALPDNVSMNSSNNYSKV